jgi:SSS family solute:Na+ symporter
MRVGTLAVTDSIAGIDYGIIIAYLLLLLGVGYYVYRRAPSFEQYLLAGRMMSTPILICTLASTYYGLDILFGSSEIAFNDGVVAYFGYSVLTLGIYFFAAISLSKRLRQENFTSLPEILERNYGRSTATFGAIGSLLYSLPTTSLFALGRVGEVVFGIQAHYGALLLGGIALTYTLMGGLMAVAITDTIQFVLMCVTVAIGVTLLMQEVGGFAAVEAVAPPGYFAPFGGMPIWLMLSYASLSISILVDPGYYQRIFAARSPRQARNAMLIAIVVWAAFDWIVAAGGMLAMAAVKAGILPADIHSNDALLMAVAHALPIGLTGLFLAGVLAMAMSTMDSYTLVAGANISYDLYRPLVKPNATDRELVRVTKIGVIASWVFGFLIAFAFDRIMALLVFVMTILTSTVLVPIMISVYYKGRKTALAGLLSCSGGLISVLLFYLGLALIGEFNEVYGTFIWSFTIAGETFSIWQEYALFFCLPISLLGFLIGNRFGPAYKHPGVRMSAS